MTDTMYNHIKKHIFIVKKAVFLSVLYCLQVAAPQGCPICQNGLERFGYRDVLLLRQFLSPDGYIINRRETGICPRMQRRIARSIRRSRQMGELRTGDEMVECLAMVKCTVERL